MLTKPARYQPKTTTSLKPFRAYTPDKGPPAPKMVRTPSGLVDVLCDEIDRMRQGKTTARNANAVAKLASTVVATVSLELEIQKFRHRQPEQAPLPSDYPMGFGAETYPQLEEHDEQEEQAE